MSDRKKVAKSQKEAMIEKLRQKDRDRLTDADIKASRKFTENAAKSEMEKDIEIYQNDRTKGLPQEAYEQEDQELRYEAPIEKMNMGGECRGSKAIRGKKFTGVF